MGRCLPGSCGRAIAACARDPVLAWAGGARRAERCCLRDRATTAAGRYVTVWAGVAECSSIPYSGSMQATRRAQTAAATTNRRLGASQRLLPQPHLAQNPPPPTAGVIQRGRGLG